MSLMAKIRTVLTLGSGVVRGVSELTAARDPLVLFGDWFAAARRSGLLLPESTCLATASPEGRPSARMVLLKGFGSDGFVFYTSYDSRKSEELLANPQAALCLHWPVLQRQVRIEGSVTKTTPEESAAYFRTRPRGSQLGAWASTQSAVLADRAELERRYSECETQYHGVDVPLPPFWGGFRLRAERIEFWQGRLNRLHDRLLYHRVDDGWRVERLAP